jgi:hypothetical protein
LASLQEKLIGKPSEKADWQTQLLPYKIELKG